MRYAMIMAGGAGTRLWPMSRTNRPKQLLPFIGGRSLLELAFARVAGGDGAHAVIEPAHTLICTAEKFRDQVRRAIPALRDEQILGEPAARDTANAVGLTAAVLARRDPDAVFAVLTSDHIIAPEDRFRSRLDTAIRVVETGAAEFATFSIKPTFPATGYGYIERGKPLRAPGLKGVYRCVRFVEKPTRRRAQQYIDAGTFGWNSGMFVFRARAFLDAMKRFMPESHEGLSRIAAAWGTRDQPRLLNDVYPTLPKISVDYGVMEPVSKEGRVAVALVTLDISWMDVGSWPTYGDTLKPDRHGNRTNAAHVSIDSAGVLAVSDDPSHTIATIGCKDIIIVHTKDATLVLPAKHAQKVRDVAGLVPRDLQ
jgi:mannose-1-phosphate guanylyltransferase